MTDSGFQFSDAISIQLRRNSHSHRKLLLLLCNVLGFFGTIYCFEHVLPCLLVGSDCLVFHLLLYANQYVNVAAWTISYAQSNLSTRRRFDDLAQMGNFFNRGKVLLQPVLPCDSPYQFGLFRNGILHTASVFHDLVPLLLHPGILRSNQSNHAAAAKYFSGILCHLSPSGTGAVQWH
mgnify:CR=1 FL=1